MFGHPKHKGDVTQVDEALQTEAAHEEAAPKKKGFFGRRWERRRLWKQERKKQRQALKDHYRYAPWHIRVWNLYLRTPVTAIFTLLLAAFVFFPWVVELGQDIVSELVVAIYDTRNEPVDEATIHQLSPIDEEGAARIDALGSIDADDTWTICVYMIGSNLEDFDENDLSRTTRMEIAEIANQVKAEESAKYRGYLKDFSTELEASGLDLPDYLYNPVKPSGEMPEESNPNKVSDMDGFASNDIGEMTSAVWSDNISIVIQPGGATRWSNSRVNPNRTQRFLYKGSKFSEIDTQTLQRSGTPETLSEFLEYCRDNYPADHTMLILWNHGGGAFGYGNDTIFGDSFELSEIRDALSAVYEPSSDNPAFDVIGFDACLMSSLEVTHALDGFARYFAVSEETEPGDGWDYAPWLQAMTDDPTMNPAQICRAIADSYTDHYMTQNANVGFLINNDVTFSVLDGSKTGELYDAYCELAKAQLIDATTDLSVLSDMGRCSDRSTHYAGSDYDVFNTIDLGTYVDHTVDFYPEQSSKVKQLLGESVLYHRENGSLSDSQGISVYLPGTVNSFNGMLYALLYLNEACEDDATRALYYYKIAGTLNEELAQYAKDLTGNDPKKLDVTPFREFGRSTPELDGTTFVIPVDGALGEMLQAEMLELACFDEDEMTITTYGRDEFVSLEGDGTMSVDFDGQWVYLGGQPLAIEIASASPSAIDYRSKVKVDGTEKYLEFSFDRDTERFTLKGVREIVSSPIGEDELAINVFANSKTLQNLEVGSEVTPIYEVTNLETQDKEECEGEAITVKKSTKIELKGLDDGYYLTSAVITDVRGDEYYSPVMAYTMKGGKVIDRALDDGFYDSSASWSKSSR